MSDAIANKFAGAIITRAKSSGSIDDLWTSERSFESHVKKRIALGHVENAEQYRNEITRALHNASSYVIAMGGKFQLIELKTDERSVIFNDIGQIKTAYRQEPNMPSFSDNHLRLGYKVYENQLSDRIRSEFMRLFGPR